VVVCKDGSERLFLCLPCRIVLPPSLTVGESPASMLWPPPPRGPFRDCTHPCHSFLHISREWITRTQVHALTAPTAPSTPVAEWTSTPHRARAEVEAAAKQAAQGAALVVQQARMLGLQRAASAKGAQRGRGTQAPNRDGERDLDTR
jgi:hypothetical protein